MGTLKTIPCSVQPMHGWPMPMGQAPGTSQKWSSEQLAWVCGPLQPSL